MNGEFATVLGPDARFKGEISFEKGLRILGHFEGQIKARGALHVAEGARVQATIEAANVKVDGEIKGNITCTEKLHLATSAKIEGDLRVARLEMSDGAQFIGHVSVGALGETGNRTQMAPPPGSVRTVDSSAQPMPRPRPNPAEPMPIPMPAVR
ncbi:MAG: polymer-forming cytoskeletal protein [Phycisphaerae bacterium]